jgi:hypothetical protein
MINVGVCAAPQEDLQIWNIEKNIKKDSFVIASLWLAMTLKLSPTFLGSLESMMIWKCFFIRFFLLFKLPDARHAFHRLPY